MPTLDAMAGKGLRYNRFHTTALCSPTRTALLTGRNHHVNNAGAIMELATAFQGNTGIRPNSVTPLAQILRLNGYSTAAFGKYHETPPWEASVSGPYDRWPTGSGFDKFYGFIGGETNQWAPAVYDGVTRVETPRRPELPLHHRHDRPRHRLDALPAGVDPGQALLYLLRDGRHPRAASRAQGVHREVQGQVRSGLGQAARRDAGAADRARRGAGGHEADRSPGRDPGLGLALDRPEATVRAADGDLRGIWRAHRSRGRPPGRGDPGHGRARQHAVLLHRGGQRIERRGRPRRQLQRDPGPERHHQRRLLPVVAHRRLGRAGDVPALLHRLGARRQHALPVDEAGRVALRGHAQRDGRSTGRRGSRTLTERCVRSSIT